MRHLPKDFWVALVMLTLALLYWMEADAIAISPLDGEVNAAAMPKMLAGVLATLSILLLAQALLLAQRLRNKTQKPERSPDKSVSWREHLRAMGLIGLGAAYIVLLPFLGYLISVALLIAAVAMYMGERLAARLIGVTLGVALCYQLLFVQVLHIQLPAGLLGLLHF